MQRHQSMESVPGEVAADIWAKIKPSCTVLGNAAAASAVAENTVGRRFAFFLPREPQRQ